MKKYAYPAVIYYNSEAECYCVAIEELGIFCDGETVEQAHERAREFLGAYLEFALAENIEIAQPASFKEVVLNNPKQLVVLVESIINDKNKVVI